MGRADMKQISIVVTKRLWRAASSPSSQALEGREGCRVYAGTRPIARTFARGKSLSQFDRIGVR